MPSDASPPPMIPLSEPVLRGNEWAYVKACLDTGWVSSVGPFVERFEAAVARAVGVVHAVAVASGTAALHVALQLAGVEPGEEVLVSTLTFIAPVNAIRYCGAHPVFVDADASTWQFDVDAAARFLREVGDRRSGACYNRRTGRRIRAILPVHILGSACAMDRISALAAQYGLCVVEDAAQALGVRLAGRHAGTFGQVGALSFNGNKVVTSGGGGMLITDDAGLARRARYLTTQAKDDPDEYIHHEVGYNYRLTNVQAALGLAQLEQLDALLARKRAIASMYADLLADAPELRAMRIPDGVRPTHWLVTVLLPPSCGLDARRAVVRMLREAGVGARPLWHPVHALPPYRDEQVVGGSQAAALYQRAISLPSGAGLSDEQVRQCAQALRRAVAEQLADRVTA